MNTTAEFHSACNMLLQNRFEDAEQAFTKLVSVDTERHPAFGHNLGLCKELQGDYDVALATYQAVLRDWPDCASTHVCVANCHRHLHGFTASEEALKTAMQADRDDPRPHILLSELLFHTGKHDYNPLAIDAHLFSNVLIAREGSVSTRHYAQAYYMSGGTTRYHMFAENSLHAAGLPTLCERVYERLKSQVPTDVEHVVLYLCNAGYKRLTHNSLASKSPLDETFTLVVCLDEASMRLSSEVHDATFVLLEDVMPQTHSMAIYGTRAFNRITALKPVLVQALLRMNKVVVFSDSDVVWKKPVVLPLVGHMLHEKVDLATQVDVQPDGTSMLCTGFFAARPSETTLCLFDPSHHPPMCAGEQPVINHMVDCLDVPVWMMPPNLFPNGVVWQALSESEREDAAIVHHNFILGNEKMHVMKMFRHWHLPPPRTVQERIVDDTSLFRPQPHCSAGYGGPWVENAVFEEFMKRGMYRAESKCLYLPIFWTDVWFDRQVKRADNVDALQAYVNTLDRSRKYMTVLQNANGFGVELPPDLDITVFSAGNEAPGGEVVPIPLLKRVLQPATGHPTREIAFAGSLTGYGNHNNVRGLMYSALNDNDDADVLFYQGPQWEHVMGCATFNLCPRGFGPTSFRLYEALQLGRIPVYIHDDTPPVLPFVDDIDWTGICIFVHATSAITIPSLCKRFDVPSALQRIAACRHMFTYEYVADYVLSAIE